MLSKFTQLSRRISYFFLAFLLLMLMNIGGAKAQISSNYSFSSSQGTYSPISATSGASVHKSGTWLYYDMSGAITIPSFAYNGSTYTTMYIHPNKFISLGTTAPYQYENAPIRSTNTTSSGIIAAAANYSQNSTVSGSSPAILYQQIGSEMIVQWQDVASYANAGRYGMQIRLNTCNGIIKIVYDSVMNAPTGSGYNNMQVGLRGSSNSDYLNRSITSGNWSSTTNGTANTSTCLLSSTTNSPNKGLTFTYTPTSGSSLTLNNINYNSAAITSIASGTSNKEILRLDFDVTGLSGSLNLDTVVVNSNNTSDGDVSAVKLYASSMPSFSTSTATQIGSSTNFSSGIASFNTLAYALTCQVTYIYVVYDISSGATVGDIADAKINSNNIKVSGSSYPSTNKSPAGSRTIQNPMTYVSSTATQNNTVWVEKGTANNEIIGVQIQMSASGAQVNLDSLVFNTTGTNGTNNATTNIQNAKVWYTGNSSTFATTTQFGTTVAAPNGQINFISSTGLSTGINYFWLTYDIKSAANTSDSADAQLLRSVVAGTAQTPSTASPAGYRRIRPAYCAVNHSYNNTFYTGMGTVNVNYGSINNTTTAGGTVSPGYTNYPTLMTNAQRKSTQALNVTLGTYTGTTTIGICVWIDFNQNGLFTDAGEQVVLPGSTSNAVGNSTNTYNITIPCTAAVGATKMRVMSAYFSSTYWASPCQTFGYGETEDYILNITDSAMVYASSFANQTNTLDVKAGTTKNQIIGIPVVVSGCSGSLNATSFSFNTTGSTSASADIDSARVYWTGNSSTFAVTTQFGSVGSPSGSFSITGTRALVGDTNWFWLAYDIDGSATIGNFVDAEATSLTVGGNAYTPTITAPTGNRMINVDMTYVSAVATQNQTGSVVKNTRYNQIIGMEVVMTSGASVNLTQLKWTTTGCTNAADIDTARVYYTGNSPVFATTTLHGTYVLNPNGSQTNNTTRALMPGTNYFWVAYSIKTGATTNNLVDATFTALTVDGSPQTPTVVAPSGSRKIIPPYCTMTSAYNSSNGGITNVSLGSINNTTGLPAANAIVTDYSSTLSTDLQKGSSQTLSISSQSYSYMYVSGWIDYNQDGDFADAGEKLGQIAQTTTGNTVSYQNNINFVVPCNSTLGQTRMRVRSEYWYANLTSTQDPCSNLYSGYYAETEDYGINILDSALNVVSATTLQDLTTAISAPSTNNQIVRVQVVTKGCSGNQTLSAINLNTAGSTDANNDIDSVIVFWTGNSNTFATTTLFGKTGTQNGSYAVTGSLNLTTDTNNFWVCYRTTSGATIGDYVDAQCASVVVNSTTYNTSIASPSGNRQILNPMTYSSSQLTQNNFSGVSKGSTNQRIAGLEIVMTSGTTLNLDSLIFSNMGTMNVSTNITNVKCFYTGNSSTYATTTQYSSTQVTFYGTGGEIRFGQSLSLLPGTNYFWLTYDIKTGATLNDSIDATASRAVIAGSNYTPSPSTINGKRYVIPAYCTAAAYYNYYNYGVTNVNLGSINNTTNTPTAFAQYNDYTSMATTVQKYNTYTLSLDYAAQYGYGNIAAWIDWNNDGDWADAGEKLGQPAYSTSNTTGTVTISFTVPCFAVNGSTRMRIREEYYANGGQPLDPCNTVYQYAGEVEDYTITIIDSAMSYLSSVTSQTVTSDVPQNTNNVQVIGVRVNTTGCASGLNLTQLNFNTTGSTSASTDITGAKVWFTGQSNVFASTTQFGTVSSPNGNFSVSGSSSLFADSNFFWLTYDVASGAAIGDKIDAQCTGLTINSNNYTPSVTNPSGDRTINNPMTYNSNTWTKRTGNVERGYANTWVSKVTVNMSSGASVNLDSLVFNTTGITTPASDVTNAKVWYTGSSNSFAATTQYGATATSPNGTISVAGTVALQAGDNNFWITYDLPAAAPIGDSVVANFASVYLSGASQAASPSTIAGKNRIIGQYCVDPNPLYGYYGTGGITNVTLGSINNTTGVQGTTAGSAYRDYTSQTATLKRGRPYTINVTSQTYNYNYTSVWIDFNNDGDWVDAGEKVGQVVSSNGATSPYTNTITFTVPCAASLSTTKMRVKTEYIYYTGAVQNPCSDVYNGYYKETEDYSITLIDDASHSYASSSMSHPSNVSVQTGATNVQIAKVMIVTAGTNCAGSLQLTSLNFNTTGTNGTNNPSTNISTTSAYYTGNSNTFATTTTFGSAVSTPSGSFNFSGSQNLAMDTNYVWLVYNVASGATIGDTLDVSISNMTISSNNYTPSNNDPSGYRKIDNPMTYVSSSTAMPNTNVVSKGATLQSVIQLKVTMSAAGYPIAMDTFYLTPGGTNNISTNIQNARVYSTGSSSTFATTTQYGTTTIAAPSGTMLFRGTNVNLLNGDNYFWLIYGIKTTANTNDSISGTFDSLRVGGVNNVPSNTTVSTKRRIINAYCSNTSVYNNGNGGITNVTLGSINSTSGVPAGTAIVSDYTSLSTNLTKYGNYTLNVTSRCYSYMYVSGWIDYNLDGTFQTGEKLGQVVTTTTSNTTPYNSLINFTVPCSSVNGPTRMRVRCEYWYSNTTSTQDPCSNLYSGYYAETEDYTVNIQDSSRTITGIVTTTASTLDVSKGTNNNRMLMVRVNSAGCNGTQTLSQLNFNTTGTTDVADITAAKVFYTGSSPVFAATTQYGSTVSSPSGSFNVSGSQVLGTDSAFFWLTYDISSSAPVGTNVVDAEGTVAAINSNSYGTSSAPAGNRLINVPMSYTSSTATQNATDIDRGTVNGHIIGAQIVMNSGTAQNLTNMEFTVNGSTSVANITSAKLWYTGNSSTFATTTQYGANYNSPIYGISFNGNTGLLPGTNYFWLTYNVPNSATLGDSVDAEFYSFDLDSASTVTTQYPTVSNPAGKRKIVLPYCTPSNYTNASSYLYGITNVNIGTINNTTSVANGAVTHFDYTSQSSNIQKAGNYSVNLSVAGIYSNQYTAAWIDFDGDHQFSASEKLGQVYTNTTTGSVTFSFTVPCTATVGTSRLRIRSEYYASNGQALDPCNYIYQYGGETEDYTLNITDSALSIVSVNTTTASTLDVFANSTNRAIIAVPVVVKGCSGSLAISQLDFNTNGSSNASNDITNAKVWYTGNTNTFASTTQFGSTSSSPSGNFSVTGSMALIGDTNWFWLSYDIANGATTNNYVDAECSNIIVSSNNYTPSTTAPSGNRMVNVPMTYSSSTTTTSATSIVEKGSKKNQIVGVQIVMSTGASVNLSQLNLSTNGSTNANTDIDSAKVYFTGNSNVFATTTLYGQYASPNGSFNVMGTAALLSGTNYFWVVYDIKTGATTNDSVDAECTSITVDGNAQTPSVTAPTGKRRILPPYCVGGYSNDYHTQMFMSRVKVGAIDNTTSYGTTYPFYNYYNQTCSLTVGMQDTLKVQGGNTYNISVGVFIDLNQDGDFADAGENVGNNTNVSFTALNNVILTIPSGALQGVTRMRVRNTYQNNTVTACGTLTYSGETEDYNVYIAIPSAPSAVISPSGTTSFCQGIGQVFTATPLNNAYTYTWKEGATVKQTGTGTSNATFSYNPAYSGTYNITCSITDQYSQTGVSAATSTTINSNAVGGTSTATSNSICAGQNDTLSVSGNSGTIQWQSKVGVGAWTDIISATSSSIIVAPITTTQYRAKSTLGVCGSAYSNISTISIGTSAIWTGQFSTVWTYGPNWCSGTVPTNSTNVTIGTGTNQPVVTSTVYCSNLTINAGATVTINNGGVLQIGGTFTKNGTLTHNYGKIIFTSPQTLPANVYYWLSLNGSGTYTLAGNTIVNSNLNIVSGVTVATAGYNLTAKRDVACNGTISGTGNLVLDNSTLNQTVSGSATLGNVKLNLGSSALAVRFYNSITITGKLDISGGFAVIYNNTTLTVGSTSTSTGDIKFNYAGAQIVSANSATNTLLKVLGNSTAPQITGAIITTNANVYMDRPLGMKLGGNTSIGGVLTVMNGTLALNGYDLNVGTTSSNTGNYSSSGAASFLTNASTSAGYLRFLGGSGAAQITNVRLGSQYKVLINRGNAQNKGISMGNSFTVNNQVIVQNGSIDLNGSVLTLGSSASIYEATSFPIFGSTGYIQTTRSLGSALTNGNVAGLGLLLTTTGALGNTNIVRGHTVQSSGGNPSIKRYYTLTAANATTISSMTFNFYQPEYNGFSTATKLGIAKSTTGGASWIHVPTYSRNMYATSALCVAKNVSLTTSATMFTIGDTTAGYAPSVVSNNVAQVENTVQNVWPNPFNENVNIQFNMEEEGNIVIRVTDMNGKTVRNLNMQAGQGSNTISINDMKELPAGAYMINIIGNDKVSTMRVVKANN